MIASAPTRGHYRAESPTSPERIPTQQKSARSLESFVVTHGSSGGSRFSGPVRSAQNSSDWFTNNRPHQLFFLLSSRQVLTKPPHTIQLTSGDEMLFLESFTFEIPMRSFRIDKGSGPFAALVHV